MSSNQPIRNLRKLALRVANKMYLYMRGRLEDNERCGVIYSVVSDEPREESIAFAYEWLPKDGGSSRTETAPYSYEELMAVQNTTREARYVLANLRDKAQDTSS